VSKLQRFLCGLYSNHCTLKGDVAGGKTNSGVEPSGLQLNKVYCSHAGLKVSCRVALETDLANSSKKEIMPRGGN
jgi:hypothetical protein